MANNTAAIESQQVHLRSMYERHVSKGSSYALVDFPDHSNVGDSAIWLGEIALLSAITGQLPKYVSTHEDFDVNDFKSACPDGVLFIHGGGNLGDIWPHHQIFRERLISQLPEWEIVQLPQSIKFRANSGVQQFASVVKGHPNFTLYVRDDPSYALAKQSFDCRVELVPDSAFGMGAQHRRPAACSALLLLRTDSEQAGYDPAPFASVRGGEIADWLQDSTGSLRAARYRRRAIKLMPSLGSGSWRVKWYNWLANNRVQRGMTQLARGNTVITDRLHGHILCVLLDIPHVALDNDYGKVSNYIKAWTNDYGSVATAKSSLEAVNIFKAKFS